MTREALDSICGLLSHISAHITFSLSDVDPAVCLATTAAFVDPLLTSAVHYLYCYVSQMLQLHMEEISSSSQLFIFHHIVHKSCSSVTWTVFTSATMLGASVYRHTGLLHAYLCVHVELLSASVKHFAVCV